MQLFGDQLGLVIGLFAVVASVAFVLMVLRARIGSRTYAYRTETYLLTKAERSFFGVLTLAIGDAGRVFVKVRVADILKPQRGLHRSGWQRAFNAIAAKHFDFVVCDPGDSSVKLVVELDDASHGSTRRKRRDRFLDEACASAGLPFLRVPAANAYVVSDIRRAIGEVLQSRE